MSAATIAYQRPYWYVAGCKATANGWAIADLGEWLAVTRKLPGRACQVLWREQLHCQYRHRNFLTPAAAAQFAQALQRDPKVNLLDVGIDPDHPVAWTEFAPAGSAH